jgi:hypothetical protein
VSEKEMNSAAMSDYQTEASWAGVTAERTAVQMVVNSVYVKAVLLARPMDTLKAQWSAEQKVYWRVI